jgi:UDPglucose 6-dehydrogenase
MARAGFNVVGTDTNPVVEEYLLTGAIPYLEAGVREAIVAGVKVGWRTSIEAVVEESDILFVAVQTPHAPQYEGCEITPETKRDFEYSYLSTALRRVNSACTKELTVVIVSTVNPGTTTREFVPIFSNNSFVRLIYSPAFIAMGTTMRDFAEPEMVIVGTASDKAFQQVSQIHRAIHNAPILRLSIISCEMVKMTYNTFIGMKIVFANVIGELCEKLGGDSDEVVQALSHATERIISPKYLSAGMGDGGGCHPRDQIALSWLADRIDLSVDVFGFLMRARDKQTSWQAQLCRESSEVSGLPIRICGREYKAESNLQIGSPSRLLKSILGEVATWQDDVPTDEQPAVFFIGVNHKKYQDWRWPLGSIVIDPWGIVPDMTGIVVHRIGRRIIREII